MKIVSIICITPLFFIGCQSETKNVRIASTNQSALSSNHSASNVSELWQAEGGPDLIASFLNSTSNRRSHFDNLLFAVNEIFSAMDSQGIEEIINAVQPLCADISSDSGLPDDAEPTLRMGIKPFFEFRYNTSMSEDEKLRAFQLAYFDQICPSQIEQNLVLQYAATMQKMFLKISRESGGPAEWPFLDLNSITAESFMIWILSKSPAMLRKGLILPPSISHREFFDVMASKIFGDNFGIQLATDNMFGENSVLPITRSEVRMEAVGRFVALSFLEMEPLFSFSEEIILQFLNPSSSSSHPLLAALVRGFHEIVYPEELASLNAENLSGIFVGQNVVGEFVSVDDDSLKNEAIRTFMQENPSAVRSWAATTAAHARGVALGHLGRKIILKISVIESQHERIIRRGGWHISLSRAYIDEELGN